MSDKPTFEQRLETLKIRLWNIGQIFAEIGKGYWRQDPTLFRCMVAGLAAGALISMQLDVWAFKQAHAWRFYPHDGWMFRLYVASSIWLPIFAFGIWVRNDKKKFANKLKDVFDLVGLKNALGSYPNFLSLEPITGGTMKLRLTNGAFPLTEWIKRKERLEANMRIFIDEIKQELDKGVTEVTFSYEPMPSKVTIENIRGFRDYKFLIGRDRSKSYVGSFVENPHFLVAGESGGGKSAFVRQLVTTIKVNQPESEFYLLDFKGGVEFWQFEKLPGMKVVSDIAKAARTLNEIASSIELRTKKLREMNLTDINYFFESDHFKRMNTEEKRSHTLGRRIFIVVDECAEIFLFGLGHPAEHTRNLRAAMSRITRLGRSVGIHAVIATQRPDKNAVDPQVKSNLPTTVCYRINDIGGSLAVLGNGRAKDLPGIPGRAVLKTGSQEVEIQTPFLEPKEAVRILEQAFPGSELQTQKPSEEFTANPEVKNDDKI
jgi:S-DNA-T family DNA segregation ATPase FtsK/SpoIIIE